MKLVFVLSMLASTVSFAAVDNSKLNGAPSPLAVEKIDADLSNLKAMLNETSSDKESQDILTAEINDLQKAHEEIQTSSFE